MDPKQKLALQKMMTEGDVPETTDQIRELRHSSLIREQVFLLESLRKQHSDSMDPDEFDQLCTSECSFLFSNYTDIFNKVKKNEIDMGILGEFLKVLARIENKEIDQHEGSFEVGKLLKKLYIDSALRKSAHLDDEASGPEPAKRHTKSLTWRQYKLSRS